MCEEEKIEYTRIRKYIERYRNGEAIAREELIVSYMPRASKIARLYSGLGVDDEDLLQSSYEGLIEGVDFCLRTDVINPPAKLGKCIEQSVKKTVIDASLSCGKKYKLGAAKLHVLMLYRDLKDSFSREEIEEMIDKQLDWTNKKLIRDTLEESGSKTSFENLSPYDALELQSPVIDAEDILIREAYVREVLSRIPKNTLTPLDHDYIKLACMGEDTSDVDILAAKLNCSRNAVYKAKKRIAKFSLFLKEPAYCESFSEVAVRSNERTFVKRRQNERAHNKNRI